MTCYADIFIKIKSWFAPFFCHRINHVLEKVEFPENFRFIAKFFLLFYLVEVLPLLYTYLLNIVGNLLNIIGNGSR